MWCDKSTLFMHMCVHCCIQKEYCTHMHSWLNMHTHTHVALSFSFSLSPPSLQSGTMPYLASTPWYITVSMSACPWKPMKWSGSCSNWSAQCSYSDKCCSKLRLKIDKNDNNTMYPASTFIQGFLKLTTSCSHYWPVLISKHLIKHRVAKLLFSPARD